MKLLTLIPELEPFLARTRLFFSRRQFRHFHRYHGPDKREDEDDILNFLHGTDPNVVMESGRSHHQHIHDLLKEEDTL